jgi:hypothetical protein
MPVHLRKTGQWVTTDFGGELAITGDRNQKGRALD